MHKLTIFVLVGIEYTFCNTKRNFKQWDIVFKAEYESVHIFTGYESWILKSAALFRTLYQLALQTKTDDSQKTREGRQNGA